MQYTHDDITRELLEESKQDKELIAALSTTVDELLKERDARMLEITSLRGQVAVLKKMLSEQEQQQPGQ